MRIQRLLATDSDGNIDLDMLKGDEPSEKSDVEEKTPDQMLLSLNMKESEKKVFEMMNWSKFWNKAFADNKSLLHVDF